MTPSIFTNEQMDDGKNTYGVSRAIFSMMAQMVDALCACPSVTLAEIGNLDAGRKGCGITIWSGRYQHRIEIWGKTVSLSIQPMDGLRAFDVFAAEAEEYPVWLRLHHLILGAEGYETPDDSDVLDYLQTRGINPHTGLA